MAIVLDGTTGITTPGLDTAAGNSDLTTLSVAGNEISAVNSLGFRNRIINGDMRISQASAGAATTPSVTGVQIPNFAVDRFRIAYSQNSKLTAQQNRNSVTPPTGFKNYLGVSVAATATVSASDFFLLGQGIEGYNVADLGWGSASAQTVTLSFWAYSNTTGTFGGAVNNSAFNRSYVFEYIVNAANTWEYKTVTIAGDTTGTWVSDNTGGAYVWFSLGTGSTSSKASGSWGAGEYYSATGATSLMGSTSNYLYITGVQLEAGSVASPFERVNYTGQLAMCQRYYEVNPGRLVGTFTAAPQASYVVWSYKVTKRAIPTVVNTAGGAVDEASASAYQVYVTGSYAIIANGSTALAEL